MIYTIDFGELIQDLDVRTTDEFKAERVVDCNEGQSTLSWYVGDNLRERVVVMFMRTHSEGAEIEIKVADAVKTVREYGCRECEEGLQVVEGEGCVAVHQGNRFGITWYMSVCLLLQGH